MLRENNLAQRAIIFASPQKIYPFTVVTLRASIQCMSGGSEDDEDDTKKNPGFSNKTSRVNKKEPRFNKYNQAIQQISFGGIPNSSSIILMPRLTT